MIAYRSIILCLAFYIPFNMVHVRFIHVFACISSCPLLLCSILFYDYATIHLYFLVIIDIFGSFLVFGCYD